MTAAERLVGFKVEGTAYDYSSLSGIQAALIRAKKSGRLTRWFGAGGRASASRADVRQQTARPRIWSLDHQTDPTRWTWRRELPGG